MLKQGKNTIGIALGGGGARGTAHIGVLQILHNEGIRINQIAGSSAGAVIGAMYAAKEDPIWVENRINKFVNSKIFKGLGTDRMIPDRDPHSAISQIAKKVQDQFVFIMSMNKTFILKKDRLRGALDFLLPVKTFEELKVPLQISATDIQTGEIQIYSSGNLLEAVVRSASIPGYIEPTHSENKIILDGSVGLPNPVSLISHLVDFTIAVDVKKTITPVLNNLNIYEILQRCELISYTKYLNQQLMEADLVVRPVTKNIHWSQFDQFPALISSGRTAMETLIPKLEKFLSDSKKWSKRINRWFEQKTY